MEGVADLQSSRKANVGEGYECGKGTGIKPIAIVVICTPLTLWI